MSQDTISTNCTVKLKTLNFDFCLNVPKVKNDQIYFIVYKTTNLLKNEDDKHRFYVGQHIQVNIDPYEFDGYYGSGKILFNSLNKYGKENFIRETLEICKNEYELDEKEFCWINSLSANNIIYPECGGMNLQNGGKFARVGTKLSKESLEKISKTKRGKLRKICEEDTSEKRIDMKGYKNSQSKYKFELSNGEDYYIFFNKNERTNIKHLFNKYKTNIIEYRDIVITRIPLYNQNEENSFNSTYIYIMSNGEDYWKFFNKKERLIICKKFSRENKPKSIVYNGIEIKRFTKEEYLNGENNV